MPTNNALDLRRRGSGPAVQQHVRDASKGAPNALTISIVMPCLNEADTVAECVRTARQAIEDLGIDGEVVVADNGSTDGSIDLARRAGARVVHVTEKGYGAAIMAGVEASYGKYVLMGDADDSYDFAMLPAFLAELEKGAEHVQGCRMPSGGGRVMPGAMPVLHRWWGNPMFSWMARTWFHAPIHDVQCGLRAFTRELFDRIDLRCVSMEFSSEMVVKAALAGARMSEVPIILRPDGRTTHPPHLKTFRDGWRNLRFYLMYSPRWLYLLPGTAAIVLGLAGCAIALPGLTIGGVHFDVSTLLVSGLAVLLGYQAIIFAILTKAFAIAEGMLPTDLRMARFFRIMNLERGLLLGLTSAVLGFGFVAVAVNDWRLANFGPLDYPRTLRWVIPGVILAALGVETVFASFFASVLGLPRRGRRT